MPVGERLRFFQFQRSKLRDAAEQGIDAGAHFHFIGPLAMQRFLQDVDGFQAKVDDGRRRLDFAVTQAADQVFHAMGNRAKTLQSHLRSGTLHGVNRAEELVDLFGIVVALKRNQAIAHDLQMFFGFRLEEFQNLVRRLRRLRARRQSTNRLRSSCRQLRAADAPVWRRRCVERDSMAVAPSGNANR